MWLQVVEHALGLLPTEPATVQTPTDSTYRGLRCTAHVCGVSVIRSGEAMESALRSCWKGIDIGKILVERRHHSRRPPKPSADGMRRASSAALPLSAIAVQPSPLGAQQQVLRVDSSAANGAVLPHSPAAMTNGKSASLERNASGKSGGSATPERHSSGELAARTAPAPVSPLRPATPVAQDGHGTYYQSLTSYVAAKPFA